VTGSNTVALTFDDGPDPVQTPKILALLAEHRVTATFCLVGRNVQKDLERTNEAIRAAAPGADIPFFRAPGGLFTDRLVQVAHTDGMASLYWQVDPQDWDHHADSDDDAHTDRVIANVQRSTRPGSIILSHDFNQPDTIAAYERLLPWLTERFTLGVPVPPAPPAESEPPTSSATVETGPVESRSAEAKPAESRSVESEPAKSPAAAAGSPADRD
jgi:peptidoglycan/xylan/chitin deacetylase (PgdA/CDA1 family)